MKEKTLARSPLSRRDIIRLGAAAVSCTTLGRRMVAAETQTSSQRPTEGSGSVFEDNCRDGSKSKYEKGDLAVLGGLLAMWLMLTTEEWSSCLSDSNWRARLAVELNLDQHDLESIYAIATDETPYTNPTNNFKYSNKEAFIWVRKKWSDFISKPQPPSKILYGKRPCPGGKTLLKIANQL
jgi:hypothetical protein